MLEFFRSIDVETQNKQLILLACGFQVLLIAMPFYVHDALSAILVLGVLSIAALVGTTTLSVLYLCVVVAVIPTDIYDEYLSLPTGVKFYEALFVVVVGLAALTWLLNGRLDWSRRTRLDRPVVCFLALTLFSVGLGVFYGQSISQIFRDVRYPLYYGLFFVVTGFFDVRKSQTFLHLIIAVAAAVGVEYLFEFLSMINLSISGSFFRVSRLEGVLFPIGILSIAAFILFERRVHRRIFCFLALLPMGLALVLTVGRGMWIALGVGLCVLSFLVWQDAASIQNRHQRLLRMVVIPIALIGTAYFFQTYTRTSVGATAMLRVTRVAENYEEDHSIAGRFIAYGHALDKIRAHPILGNGHGVTVQLLATDLNPPAYVTVGGVDSVYLTLAMRMGVVGVVAFLWMYGAGIWRAYFLFRKTDDEKVKLFCATFISVYCALLVFGIADATLLVNRLIFIHATFLGILARLDAQQADVMETSQAA